ncbi:hypothetical protein [Pseudohongiella spirulinae]|uniref:Uncharacterized protein n=1 Tax=Pseudohongiella spirulinae TaxID=1249552 RepID=A0A0S2KAY5_9GAMM|nr:hypothetical protein [Pseudohongiella spirulinae]ALO45369.1 hypothetical protein PS2015_689 [Pseudohongiella spirulinae]
MSDKKYTSNATHITVCQRQSGAALLIFFILLFSAAAAVALNALNNRVSARSSNPVVLSEMNSVKEALLAFATLQPDYDDSGPGRLPCPDTNNDRISEANCTSNTIGRLPSEYTLGIPFSFSERQNDDRFWYVITGSFRFNPTITGLNSATDGDLLLNGQSDIVALIIDPGEAIGNQTRINNNPTNYLENGNQTGPAFVTSSPTPDQFNDRIVAITGQEMRILMTRQAALEIQRVIDSYHPANGDTYPTDQPTFEAAMAAAAAWFNSENWLSTITFTSNSANQVEIEFQNCNIIYSINFPPSELQRDRNAC